jgi:hypothetical protein
VSHRHQRTRDISVLREALHRIVTHADGFTISDVSVGIDGMLMPREIPQQVPHLVARLVARGLILRVGHESYRVAENGEQALLDLTRIVRRAHPLLEEVVASSPWEETNPGVSYVERLLRPDTLDDLKNFSFEAEPPSLPGVEPPRIR